MEVYNITISPPPGPGIIVSINVSGGTTQECTETGGSIVSIFADITLTGGAELVSVDWTVDGSSAGAGSSITPFLALGSNTIGVRAVTTTGQSDTDSIAVNVIDTQPPVVDPHFIDRRTGEPVSTISTRGTSLVITSFGATDVCDPEPQAHGVVTPTFGVNDGDTIDVQGTRQTVDLPTSALHLTVTATDSSGNTGNGQTILSISN
jgi:hypothetical protein